MNYQTFLKQLRNNRFDLWAEGLAEDWRNSNIAKEDILSIVKDFIESRLIEVE